MATHAVTVHGFGTVERKTLGIELGDRTGDRMPATTAQRYKLQAEYPGCAEKVVWVSDEIALTGAPSNPCLGGGSPENLVVLDTWEIDL